MHYVIDSLCQRGKTSWRASFHPVFDDGERGERVFVTLPNCANRRQAKSAAEEERARLEETARFECPEPGKSPTLLEYQTEWVDGLRLTGAITGSTARSYFDRLHALGDIAYKRMAEVTEHDVRNAVRFALDEGLSPNTVTPAFHTMKAAFERARDDGIVKSNPCRKVKPPKRVERRPRALSQDERLFLLSALPHLSGPAPLAVRMALSTGVRGEEARGFSWEDWDALAGTISVRKVVTQDENGAAVVAQPKTPHSIRTLPVEPSLAEALSARREEVADRCARFEIPFSKRMFILGDIDGAPYTPSRMQREFTALCKSIGLECCFHWLRHTFATELIKRNVNIRTVAEWLGHADPGFTLRTYVHSDPAALAESVTAVSALLSLPESYEPPLDIASIAKT